MVNDWLRILLLFAVCLVSLPAICQPGEAVALQIMLDKKEVELGKPLTMTLSSQQMKTSLEELDLGALKTDFHVEEKAFTQTQRQQLKVLRLYPRKTGQAQIPALKFIHSRTRNIDIEVTPAIDKKTGSIIDARITVSTLAPWQKQQVLVNAEFTSKAGILVFETPPAYADHSKIVALSLKRETRQKQQIKITRHATGWAIFPQRSGQHRLELPAIRLVRDGVTTHYFYPPLVKFTIKALPVYVPSSMPVGKLAIEILKPPPAYLHPGHLNNLQLKLIGQATQPGSLPVLSDQLTSSEALAVYPPRLEQRRIEDKEGLQSETIYNVNFKVNQQGYHPFSSIKLSYFEPASGTIKSLLFWPGALFGISWWLALILIILLVVAGYPFFIRASNGLHKYWQNIRGYLRALNMLQHAKNANELRACLAELAGAENWPATMSLREWQRHAAARYPHLHVPDISPIEQNLYSPYSVPVSSVKSGLSQFICQRHRLLRLLG